MTENGAIAERIRRQLDKAAIAYVEKRMFGGNRFMVDDKMCLGSYKAALMARVDPDEISELAKRKGAEQMVQNEREMKGFLRIEQTGFENDSDPEVLDWESFGAQPRGAAKPKAG